ncbi:MAG TPA: GGDEF domain-containing protein, partial [Actinobacteria bacterium]|nr:GGDEF domain-containing protein [Actinomycetes bacterium]HEX21609.1 GGDEF domain-containing protein [Actinomycetota bacterium]
SIDKISDGNIASLLSMVNTAAVNIENVELYEKTKILARYDSLTGLLNYREFQRILNKEVKRAKRYGHSLTMIMLDIDYFKNYNDYNGHPQGDKVLKKIGKVILNSIRQLDIGFRYGGEEFALLLLETEADAAFKIAERLRRNLAGIGFIGQEKQPNGNLTISLGIASFPADAGNKDELTDRADQALYHAKHLGRNQTRLYKNNEAA